MFDILCPFRQPATRPTPVTVFVPRRVALFSGNYNYLRDGANQALNRLLTDLERRGTEVRVYSPTSDTPAFEPAGTLVSVPLVRIPGRGEYRLSLELSAELRRDVQAFQPDILHASAPVWTGVAAQRLARTMEIPVVASPHTRLGTYARFYGAGLVRPAMERHLDRFDRGSDAILVPTAPIVNQFAGKGFDDRTPLWGRGVDRDQFSPRHRNLAWRRSHGFRDDDVVVLVFGRLVREKGPASFADVALRPISARSLNSLDWPTNTGHERFFRQPYLSRWLPARGAVRLPLG